MSVFLLLSHRTSLALALECQVFYFWLFKPVVVTLYCEFDWTFNTWGCVCTCVCVCVGGEKNEYTFPVRTKLDDQSWIGWWHHELDGVGQESWGQYSPNTCFLFAVIWVLLFLSYDRLISLSLRAKGHHPPNCTSFCCRDENCNYSSDFTQQTVLILCTFTKKK